MPNILSVSQATTAVKDVLETEFPFLWVRGEVGSLSRPPSGHVYFTLTDGSASMPVVWFKSAQWSPTGDDCVHPATGEVMECDETDLVKELDEGQEVLCAGRITVYEPRGVYQLVAEVVQAQGAGDLQLAFEAMKKKLADAGYFDEARKKPIPPSPKRVAVVTSPTGAVIRDFLRIAGERGTGASIRVYPSLVQGAKAPQQLAEALAEADADGWAEVVVLIRGGGSLEDLWAFNTEQVADALFAMRTPVVCGVGHEPDVSIADYVADLRAATPSHAAQLLWPDREQLMQRVDELAERLRRATGELLAERAGELKALDRGLAWFSPLSRLERLSTNFSRETDRLIRAGGSFLNARATRVEQWDARFHRAFGPHALDNRQERLERLGAGLRRAGRAHLERQEARLQLAGARLTGLDPEAPLVRGYAMLRREGAVVSSVRDVHAGDRVAVHLRDGRVHAEVTDIETTEEGGDA